MGKGAPLILDEWCALLEAPWNLSHELAERAVVLAAYSRDVLGVQLRIISGHRTCAEQKELNRIGQNSAARAGYSTHNAFPSLAFDIAFDFDPPTGTREMLGTFARCIGLRWGGLFVPPDPNHFDMRPAGHSGPFVNCP